jgi:hypothetical protein
LLLLLEFAAAAAARVGCCCQVQVWEYREEAAYHHSPLQAATCIHRPLLLEPCVLSLTCSAYRRQAAFGRSLLPAREGAATAHGRSRVFFLPFPACTAHVAGVVPANAVVAMVEWISCCDSLGGETAELLGGETAELALAVAMLCSGGGNTLQCSGG